MRLDRNHPSASAPDRADALRS